MGLEDLFNVVKTRLNGTQDEETADAKNDSSVRVPDDMLFKCPRCLNVVMTDELEKNLKVCPSCNYHSRLTAPERIKLISDKESFVELCVPRAVSNIENTI